MAGIKRDLSSLPVIEPTQYTEQYQRAPVANPIIGPALAAEWFAARTHDDNLPRAMPEAGPIRGSDAGKCSRAIWYRIAGIEKSDPPTIAEHWRMDLGTLIHTGLQDAITKTVPDAIMEMKVDLNSAGIPGSQHVDILNPIGKRDNGNTLWECVEIKSINGYGYKMAASRFRGGPNGPRESHVMQMALSVAALHVEGEFDMSGGRIVYVSLENLSPDLAANVGLGTEVSRFTAEWTFTLAECLEIAAREADRFNDILLAVDGDDDRHGWVDGLIPLSFETDETLVVLNPKTGAGVDSNGVGGKTWQCAYCDYQSQCIDDYRSRPAELPQ